MKHFNTFKITLATITVAILSTSCSHKYYLAQDFSTKTKDHQTIAILPAEMVFTGNLPKNLKPEDIARLEEKESLTFQETLYSSILKNANRKKSRLTVDVQDISNTQKLLKEKNISLRDSWVMKDEDLKELLGVDAIVRMRIQKERYMSDLASYGIGVANRIILGQTVGAVFPMPLPGNRTSDIFASCSLSSNGTSLWNDKYNRASDWSKPSVKIIENITNKFGKHFPYKQK
jgi:hypothetical protein